MASKYCVPRNVLLVFMVLQLISTVERQIFDFLGYMWVPILGNFFNIIFVIFGLFGLYQFNHKYMIAYSVWTFLWILFNIFVVCIYLEVGNLSDESNILDFGTGSYSWWLPNGPGCKQELNTNFTENPSNKPDVYGCKVNYKHVEVTHANIQIALSFIGFILSIFTIHYYITVIQKQREKQDAKAMYSIEYSPQVNDSSNQNTLEQEMDLYRGATSGDPKGAMTPRRVKRRSYRNSTRTRSNNKSLDRQHNRQSSRNARASSRSKAQSINPVTRLIDADQNRVESSTSNDTERYGQVNPGYQGEASRPNSVYNMSGPPTDMEASRPQSALTSYSNFHGQRKQPQGNGNRAGPSSGVINLTQESLINHENNINSSYDDLPPPPPPLSSSPSPPDIDQVSDSDNTSSVATAPGSKVPVPPLRSSIRRNEYVNLPVPPQESSPGTAIISHQEPEPQSPPPRTPARTASVPQPTGSGINPPPVPPHNYANVPTSGTATSNQQYNGARPRTTNPMYNKQNNYENEDIERSQTRMTNHTENDYEVRMPYEAETLRADTRLTMPYNNPDQFNPLSDNPPSQRSSHSEPYVQHQDINERMYNNTPAQRGSQSDAYPQHQDTRLLSGNFPHSPRGSYNEPAPSQQNHRPYNSTIQQNPLPGVPQSPRGSTSDSQSIHMDNRLISNYPQLSQAISPQSNQTETRQMPRPHNMQPNNTDRYGQEGQMNHFKQDQQDHMTNGFADDRIKSRVGFNGDADSGLHSMGSDINNPEHQQPLKRIPNGHQARDRASLRQKQRQDMSNRAGQRSHSAGRMPMKDRQNDIGSSYGYVNAQPQQRNAEAEYGFNKSAQAQAMTNGRVNGYADMNGKKPQEPDEKWYMKDSMRPIGASVHGQNCKCYRCQRKLTAI